MQWNTIDEIMSAFGELIILPPEDKYQLLEYNSDKKRYEEIERIFYEYINITNINKEAENNEKEETEKLYREHALKKQIEYMQKELDKMHPEEISDIQKFEEKVEDSLMNELAKKEGLYFCDGCFSGSYPIDVPKGIEKNKFEQKIKK